MSLSSAISPLSQTNEAIVSSAAFSPDPDVRFLMSGYQSMLEIPSDAEDNLRGVIRDTLDHPGSLIRARMAFRIGTDLGLERGRAREGAIAIEYFHTASLLFDDLPCMDDATSRRGRPCPHTVFGEASCVLGALAFINQAYASVWHFIGGIPFSYANAMNELVLECLGMKGIVGGQALDLKLPVGARDATEVLRVAEGKTVPLIRLSLMLPALAARCDESDLARLEQLSMLWGLSYQIEDDFKDELMGDSEAGKTTARDVTLGRPNFARSTGHKQALMRLSVLLSQAQEVISELRSSSARWACLLDFQSLLVAQNEAIRARVIRAKSDWDR